MWLPMLLLSLLSLTSASQAKHLDLPYNHTTKTVTLFTHTHTPIHLLLSFTDPTLNLSPTLANTSLYLDKHAKHKIDHASAKYSYKPKGGVLSRKDE